MSAIPISNDAELKKLFDRLVTDIIEAGGYARLHHHFRQAFPAYKKETDQTPAFWNFTEKAVREASLIRLARIYDQDARALSLWTLLHTIGRHPGFFDDDPVLRRVSAAYAEEFTPGSHAIDLGRLDDDIKLVSASDPLVRKLVVWRSNFGAHLSTTPILEGGITAIPSLTWDDVSTLVDRAFRIYNHYLSAFEGASWSTKIIGEEGYDFLFQLLRLGLTKFEEDIVEATEIDRV